MAQMPFGRFRGHDLEDLPDPYVLWLSSLDDLREPLASAVFEEAARRGLVPNRPREHGLVSAVYTRALEIIEQGFRVAAKRYHADVGGNDDEMRTTIEAREQLRRKFTGARR
jgi:putative quorum-sensing-regulated virulence factor